MLHRRTTFCRCVFLGLTTICSMYALAAAAADDTIPTLDVRRLVHEAVSNNPEIQAAQRRWEAAKAVIPQVETLPDPRVNLSYQNVTEREGMYAVGSVDFLTLLNSLLTLQENELELHSEMVEHEKAVARLEEILGSTP